MTAVKNETAYRMCDWEKPVQFLVTVKLDPVPGAWDNTQDFIRYFCRNNYVQSVELLEPPHDNKPDTAEWIEAPE
jgi:hypothetical protein